MTPSKPLSDATYSNRLAIRIRKLRTDAELTVDTICERMTKAGYPITVQTLYGWENGKRQLNLDAIPAIAKALKVRITDIFPSK